MQNTNINLKLLIEACRKGNRESRKRLYRMYYSFGLNLCLRYARNREEAKEMLNDGFLKVFNKIGQFNSENNFRGWLRKVLVSAAIDYHRKFKRLGDFEDLERAKEPYWENDFESNLQYEDVLKAVQQLSPNYRMVFNLYVMEGYKHSEIAEKLDITIGTSKSNLARAKSNLQKLLAPIYEERKTVKKA